MAAAALVAGLAAWAAGSIMARGGHAGWWPLVSTTVVSLSMIPPTHQADGAAAVALCGLHLVVGAVLVAGFDDPRRRARRSHAHG